VRLRDRVAVVTGGGSGIGAASALAMTHEGARVIVADIDEAGARATAAAIEKEGRRGAGEAGGRLNQPEDLARTAVFLASDEAAMITGSCVEVDGGRCI